MYRHHEESINNMIEYFRTQGAVGLILVGSVAKGTERVDSDIDGMVVLTEKLLSFYSDFWLNYYYFFKCCSLDGYMRIRTVAEIIYSLYRMILQENEILFESNRRLEEQVGKISKDTAEWVELAEQEGINCSAALIS